jgi:protein translocase SecG subunit
MWFIIGVLTLVLVLDCLILMFLILLQLPKKEAGAGIAFGAGTADALFGAGSGNALTEATKYAAGVFLALSLVMSALSTRTANRNEKGISEKLQKQSASSSAILPTTPAPSNNPAMAVPASAAATNLLLSTTNSPASATKALPTAPATVPAPTTPR